MKEATGELSGTVITVVAIAAIAAIFTLVILPIMRRSIALSTACTASGGGNYTENLTNGDTIECTKGDGCTYKIDGSQASGHKTCQNDDDEE